MIRNILKVLMIAFIITGCKQNEFEETLFRTRADPFDDVPEIDSFSRAFTINLSWKNDDACDAFYLMRTEDAENLSWSCIYYGQETSYVDLDFKEAGRYVYRLDKQRGDKLFKGESYAYGVCTEVSKDDCENNNTQEAATRLEWDLICNISCVKFKTNQKELTDVDWFYVEVPARRKAVIQIEQAGISNGKETSFYIAQPAESPMKGIQNNDIYIENSTNVAQKKYIKVYPDLATLFSNADEYLAVKKYTIKLVSIVNY